MPPAIAPSAIPPSPHAPSAAVAERQLSAPTLGTVVDEHLRWIGRWHRAAFFWREARLPAEALAMPTAFVQWVREAKEAELSHQPAIDRLVGLHEQLHRLARLLLMRAAEGDPPTLDSYAAVADKFEEFMAQCRRIERAFGAAGSSIDPLTGLRNRTGLYEELEREMNRFRRTGRPFCIALCDLDRFKSVNDTYGHDAGDRVLVATAGAVNRGIRNFDEAFRLGGEEILILLKDATLAEGARVLERLRADIAAQQVLIADGRSISVTASFGVAEADLTVHPEDLPSLADRALYEAKRTGRNRVVLAGPETEAPDGP
ncbi:diguanylate cyclase [Rhodocista pekingensis]|uniref:diguanylate cyclase n=1 Tax=Rhodocista pekingensis TaxID=201185 RepID=A0ABW2KX49_9PROT